jgi:hypothetical protein
VALDDRVGPDQEGDVVGEGDDRAQAEWSKQARGETEAERLDRNFGDLLQELRVSQAGVQILFAFLLTLAFTQRFTDITTFQRNVYMVTLLCTAAATALIIGPVSYHRIVFRRRLKPALLNASNRMAIGGLAFLFLAMVGSVLLIADVVLEGSIVGWITAGTAAWYLLLWYAIPLHARITGGTEQDDPEGAAAAKYAGDARGDRGDRGDSRDAEDRA